MSGPLLYGRWMHCGVPTPEGRALGTQSQPAAKAPAQYPTVMFFHILSMIPARVRQQGCCACPCRLHTPQHPGQSAPSVTVAKGLRCLARSLSIPTEPRRSDLICQLPTSRTRSRLGWSRLGTSERQPVNLPSYLPTWVRASGHHCCHWSALHS